MVMQWKKEILENIVSYRFLVLTALLAVLVVLSVIVGYGDFATRMEDYALLRPEQSPQNLIIEPTPASIFVKGLDANLGRLFEISVIGIEVHNNQQSVNRLFSLFTTPDMEFIIKVVLALAALLFAFDGISGEKEGGTLKLQLSSGSSRMAILLGKLLGRWALVIIPFALLFAGAAFAVSLFPEVTAGPAYWTALGMILLLAALYALVFTALGLMVSTLVPHSSTSLLLGIAAWVFFVFVVPNMGMTVAEAFAEVPPGDRVEMQARLTAIQAIYERIQQEKSGADREAGAEMIRRIWSGHQQLLEAYRPKLSAQVNLAHTLIRLSPAGALSFLLPDVAGTGLVEDLRLKNAVMQYASRNLDRVVRPAQGTPEYFAYHRASLAEVFGASAGADTLILALFALAFIGLSMAGFMRFDAR